MVSKQLKRFAIYSVMGFAGLSGCGKGEETNAPAVKLTASVVQSAVSVPPSDTHTHSVTVPFTDPGTASQVNYQSSTANGHSHTIALSSLQFTDLQAGKRIIVTSTPASDGHTHIWNILGGNYLYESMCYNCHSNDKRGSRGMSDRPQTTAQRDALQNPAAAPLSTAPPADPTVVPTSSGTLNGSDLYTQYCYTCHGLLASTTIKTRGAAAISLTIAGSGSMTSVKSLTQEQILAIASVLP
jgi:cytochrome c5